MNRETRVRIIREWLRIASSDAKASESLYDNGFYPQSLYFLEQSLEKLIKALSFGIGVVKNGSEIGHNIKGALWINSRIESRKIMHTVWDRLEYKDKLIISNEPGRFREYLKPKERKAFIQYVMSERLLKEMKIKDLNSYLTDSIKILDEDYEHFKSKSKLCISKYEYFVDVAFRLCPAIPDQQTFRYPEFNPLGIYDENHPLINHFKKIIKHVSNASSLFEEFLSIMDKNHQTN